MNRFERLKEHEDIIQKLYIPIMLFILKSQN
jgi:hypothetical protein